MKKKSNVNRILKYMGKDVYLLGLVLFVVILCNLFVIFGPKLLGDATTAIVDGVTDSGSFDINKVLKPVLWAGGLYVVSFLLQVLQEYLMAGISQRLIFTIRQEIAKKINRVSYGLIERRPVGEVLSIISSDVDQVGTGFNDFLSQSLSMCISLAGIIGIMFYINPLLALIVLVTIPLRIVYVKYNVKHSAGHYMNQQIKLAEVCGYVEEKYTGFEVVKSFAIGEECNNRFGEINKELEEATRKSLLQTSLLSPVMLAIGNFAYIGIIIAGTVLAVRGSIGVGDIQAFLSYVNNSNGPIQQISVLANRFQALRASLTRIFEFLDLQEDDDTKELITKDGAACGNVDFENVVFGYRKEKTIIDDFSLSVKKGQRVAIVGPSGCGKTTLIKLIMRFYDVNGGSIKVEGIDLRQYNRRNLRSNFGMVLQETWLFKGSVRDNIRFGRSDATDEEVIRAAVSAKADDFIRMLPGGYDFVLSEDGNNLSAGQKQLLTIARAFLANAPILILDEATSNVDTRTEVKIQEAMNELMEQRTCFVIAHRLSTIKNADVILVLKDGNIIEQGSHEELMEKGGFYCNLYNAQFEA